MPRPGYASITIRAQVKEKLEHYAARKGYATLSDTINSLLEEAECCHKLGEKLQAVEQRLGELETTCRKTYLALLRLLEELTGSEEEGPESPAGAVEDEHPARTEPRPRGAVASTSSTDTQPRRGREPRENIE